MADTAYKIFRDRIYDKLVAIDRLGEVKKFPSLNFSKFPGATIFLSDGDSDFETNEEDRRVYAFLINVYYPIKEANETDQQTAVDSVMEACDDILDSFAGDKRLNAAGALSLPTGKTLLTVQPVFVTWGATDDKKYIGGEIQILITISTT